MTLFISIYVGDEVSGSFRQDKFIKNILNLGKPVLLLKIHGHFRGIHIFKDTCDYDFWVSAKKQDFNNKVKVVRTVRTNKFSKYFVKIKYLLFIDIFGYGFFYGLFALFKIEKRQYNFDIIFSSSPSFSTVFLGYFAKKIFRSAKFIIDMRDAWASHPQINTLVSIRKIIQKKILNNADKIVTVSRYLQHDISSDGVSKNIQVLYNTRDFIDFDLDNYNVLLDKYNIKEEKKIFFFGSLPRGFHDLDFFCQSFDFFDPKIKFKIHFFGECGLLKSLINQKYNRLNEFFVFHGLIPHNEAANLMHLADIFLFFAYSGDKNFGIVTTKIFEYFYFQKPILPIDIRRGSDLEYLFGLICQNQLLVNDKESLTRIFERIIAGEIDFLPKALRIDNLKILNMEHQIFLKGLFENFDS